LINKKYRVKLYTFPAYNTTFGKLVAAHLRGEYWGGKRIVPEIAGLLFSIDRYQFKDELKKRLSKNEIIITDRFTQSAMAYHGAMFDGDERLNYAKWLEETESRLPQPDIVFLLDMPVEAAQLLITRRKGKDYLRGMRKDIYEEKINFQKRVRETYLELAKRKKNWIVIRCADMVDKKWKIRAPQEIHEEVLKQAEKFLKKE
jgi:dTMP kinase